MNSDFSGGPGIYHESAVCGFGQLVSGQLQTPPRGAGGRDAGVGMLPCTRAENAR